MKGRAWAEISVSNLIHNYKLIKSFVKNTTKVCCSVKANGYGHGAVRVAKECEKLGVDYFAVATLQEAIELRNENIKTPILILGYTPVCYAEKLVKYLLTQSVYSHEYALELNNALKQKGLKLKAHLKLDTGMGRLGFKCLGNGDNELDKALEICGLKTFDFEGVFSHFSVADENFTQAEFTKSQFDNFLKGVKYLNDRGVNFKIRHVSNSGAIFNYPEYQLDMVRAGISLYGLSPSATTIGANKLKQVMALKTAVANVKEVSINQSIGYGRAFIADKPTKIATLSIGYADGVWRRNANLPLEVVINGNTAHSVGRICMDQLMVDVTGLNVNIGDEVIIFGNGGVSIKDFAKKNETITYEIVCAVGKRVERIYVD